jgi:hypothetical protein
MQETGKKIIKIYYKIQEIFEQLSKEILELSSISNSQQKEDREQKEKLYFKKGKLNQLETIKYSIGLMIKNQQNNNIPYIKNNIKKFYDDEKVEILKKIKLLENANNNFNNNAALAQKIMYLKGRISAIDDSLIMIDNNLGKENKISNISR